jgi:uncharacterized protein (DUF58 family)
MHLAQRGYLLATLAAILAICAIWSGEAWIARLWGLPLALLLGGLAFESARQRAARVTARIECASRLQLGRGVRAHLVLETLAHRSVRVEVALALPADVGLASSARLLLETSAQRPGSAALDLIPRRLGARTWPALPARVLGQLGLAWWSRELPVDACFAIVPAVVAPAARRRDGAAHSAQAARAGGSGATFARLRAYVPGDALARVDWKARARSGKWLTREFTDEQGIAVAIAIDCGRRARLRAGALDRYGEYANAAAQFATAVQRRGDPVGLLLYSDRIVARSAPRAGPGAVARIRALLGAHAGEPVEADPVLAALALREMLPQRGLVVMLGDFQDPAGHAPLLHAVRLLAHSHQVVVAGLASAAIARLAHAPARRWLDPWVSLAAQQWELRVARERAALRRHGVATVLAAPTRLEAAVTSEYARLARVRRL